MAKEWLNIELVRGQEVQVDKNITIVACVFLRSLDQTVLNRNPYLRPRNADP